MGKISIRKFSFICLTPILSADSCTKARLKDAKKTKIENIISLTKQQQLANTITDSTTETTPFNGPQVAVPETTTTGPTEKGDQVNSYNNNINSDSSNLLAAHTTPVGEVKKRGSYTDSENTQKAGKAKGNSLTNETAVSSSALGQASNNDESQHAASVTDPSTCDSKMFGYIDKAKKKLTNKFELKKIKAFLKKPQAKRESNKKNDN